MSEHYIYCYTNIKNNMQYIGQTIKYREYNRRYEHTTNNNNGYFENEYQKHPEDFEYKIIATAPSQAIANELEKMYIRIWKTKYPNGYNLTDGGDGISGYKFSEETKKKRNQNIKKFWNSNKGMKTKQRMSESRKGKELTEEAKKKMSETRKGKHRTEETKMKISKTMKGGNNPRACSVICNTGEIFDTQTEASVFCGLKGSSGVYFNIVGKKKSAGKHPITGQKLIWYKLDSEEGQEIYKQFYND